MSYVVDLCPECKGQLGRPCEWHRAGCANIGKVFAIDQVEVVPVGDVVTWLDEHYGTPDADRFLDEFRGSER